MKKYRKTIVVGFLITLFLIVGVPLIINACYTTEHIIFYTAWGGADVLAYYGTILGAGIAVATLVITILFTQKQIKSERLRESEIEKWHQIETTVDELLEVIHPMSVYRQIDDGIQYIIKYESLITAKRPAIDFYQKAAFLCDKILTKNYGTHADFFHKLAQTTQVISKRVHECRPFLDDLYDLVEEYHECFEDSCEAFDDSEFTPYFDELEEQGEQIKAEFDDIYIRLYRPLVNEKQIEFQKIYQEINETSERILHF